MTDKWRDPSSDRPAVARPARSWIATIAAGLGSVLWAWAGLTLVASLTVPNMTYPPGDSFYLVNGIVLLGLAFWLLAFGFAVWRLYHGDRR
jgi:hypothetical protein